MAKFKTLLFWLGGVLTENLTDLALSIMSPGARGHDFVSYRKMLEPYSSALIGGALKAQVYCQNVVHEFKSELNKDQFEHKLIRGIHIRPEVVDIIQEIPEEFDRWLISDYPLKWYRVIADSLNSPVLFPTERVIFTADMKLTDIQSQIYDRLPASVGQSISNCLMIDGNSARAVHGVKHGLASIIYVYPQRLKHELSLQKILHADSDVLHPSSAERVNLP